MIFSKYVRLLIETYNSEDRIVHWFDTSIPADVETIRKTKGKLRTADVSGHVFDLRRPYADEDHKWTYADYIAHLHAVMMLFRIENIEFVKEHYEILDEYGVNSNEVEDIYNVPHKNKNYEDAYDELVKKFVAHKTDKSNDIRESMFEHAIPIGIQANGRIQTPH